KLRELLQEMNGRGRRRGSGSGGEGDWGQEMMEGQEALDKGQMSRAAEAMERALDKMRAAEERERGSRGLEGGRDRSGRDRLGRGGRGGEDDPDFGEGQGSLPRKGANPRWRGGPTMRLRPHPPPRRGEGAEREGRQARHDP